MIDAEGNRLPCERCGAALYWSERRQQFCRRCAAELGLHRICDAGVRVPMPGVRLAAWREHLNYLLAQQQALEHYRDAKPENIRGESYELCWVDEPQDELRCALHGEFFPVDGACHLCERGPA